MSLIPPGIGEAATGHDQFLVAFGKSGVVGAFALEEPTAFRRGQRVIIETDRGLEIGAIVRPATLTQARVFGTAASGRIVRLASADDEGEMRRLAERAEALFEAARGEVAQAGLNLEILDIDWLLDGQTAIIQFVGKEEGTEQFAETLGQRFGITVRCENLAVPTVNEPEPESARCDKPDCGKEAGGCSTCSTGGGCSSCGSAKTDISPYFAHLRKDMEAKAPGSRFGLPTTSP